MIDSSKFRFRIGDTVEFKEGNYKVKAFYFSSCFNDYSRTYGYTISYPYHEGSDHSYDEYGNPLGFAEDSVFYVSEYEVKAAAEERRTLEVSLDQAIKWYNSGNSTLKNLALSAYSIDKLKMNYQSIRNKIGIQSLCLEIPCNNKEELALKAYSKLRLLAYAFNEGWTMRAGSTGYFIAKDEYRSTSPLAKSFLSTNYNHRIRYHNAMMQAGVVYFRNEKDAVKAYKILGEEEIENLFR